jgi:hypothetical protein
MPRNTHFCRDRKSVTCYLRLGQEEWEMIANWYICFEDNENVVKLDVGDGYTTL